MADFSTCLVFLLHSVIWGFKKDVDNLQFYVLFLIV